MQRTARRPQGGRRLPRLGPLHRLQDGLSALRGGFSRLGPWDGQQVPPVPDGRARQPRADLRGPAQRVARPARQAAADAARPARQRRLAGDRQGPQAGRAGRVLQCRRLPGRARLAARHGQVPAGLPVGLQDLFDLEQDLSPQRAGRVDHPGRGREADPLRGAGRGRRLGLLQGPCRALRSTSSFWTPTAAACKRCGVSRG